MNASDGAYLVPPGKAELRWLGETSTFFLASGEQTGEAFALVDEQARAGESVPLHRHDDVESFYVLEGDVAFFLRGDAGATLGAGGFVHVPRGVVHGFRMASDKARYLTLTTPRHGRFYAAITVPALPGGAPPSQSVDGAAIQGACAEYGIEFVGPLPDA